MGIVNYTNLISEPRANIVEIITNDVSDPISSSGEFRKWIYSRFPDVKDANFKGFPIIIINPVMTEIDEDEGTANGKSKFVDWMLDIEIVTSDRGYGADDGKGLVHIDSISNEIYQAISNDANRNVLRNYGLSKFKLVPSIVESFVKHKELLFRRVISVSFRNRLNISV